MVPAVHVAGELWPNARNRAVGVLGSSGMGWGAMVLPFLSRWSDGAALHAASVECFNATKRQYDSWPADEVRMRGCMDNVRVCLIDDCCDWIGRFPIELLGLVLHLVLWLCGSGGFVDVCTSEAA